MQEIAVAGNEEFLLGFRLAGVRKTFNTEEDAKGTITEAMGREDIGILVVDAKTLDALPHHVQDDLNESVKPVVVRLSDTAGGSGLREKIVRAIGVDLWESD